MNPLSTHLLVEMSGCNPEYLTDQVRVYDTLYGAVSESGARVVASECHPFPGGGLSVTVILSESHISVHTFPEIRYATLDFFTCGDSRPLRGMKTILEGFGAGTHEFVIIPRGVSREDGTFGFSSLARET